MRKRPCPPQGRHLDNIIYLPGQPNRRQLSIRSEPFGKGEMLYEYI
nr:MAG TPA: hypothetical protein [Caudoviricetes sp.]